MYMYVFVYILERRLSKARKVRKLIFGKEINKKNIVKNINSNMGHYIIFIHTCIVYTYV